MLIKAIIHDWDDTITNSFESYTQFYHDFSEYHKVGEVSLDRLRNYWGGTIPEIITGLWPHLKLFEAEEKTHNFIEALKSVRKSYSATVFPQIKNSFKKLNKAGVKLGVVSSGSREQMQKIYIEQISPDIIYHEFIFDNKDLGYKKPDPRIFDKPLEILLQLGIEPENVVYVGDSFQDYYSAKNRGLKFYAVTTGVKTKEDFIVEGLASENILDNFNKILEIVGC